eukprot:833506-Pyramimonas_sp.AAC.1
MGYLVCRAHRGSRVLIGRSSALTGAHRRSPVLIGAHRRSSGAHRRSPVLTGTDEISMSPDELIDTDERHTCEITGSEPMSSPHR